MNFHNNKKMNRRDMLKLAGLAGLGMAIPAGLQAAVGGGGGDDVPPADHKLPQVPRRILGKTGQSVPILLMGTAMKLDQKFDPKFAEAMRFGVNYFDTADCYAGGTSESAVGGFVATSGKRKDLWITTKSCDYTPDGMQRLLLRSLGRLQTDQIDLFFLHQIPDDAPLNPETMRVAEKLKKEGKIRFFGFSCHEKTVAQLLSKAATLPWIDVIMFKYNFRDFGNKEINDGIDACRKANIGLIAMKTQGSAVSFDDRVKKFEGTKFTHHQAVLKAVWDDERITAAVSHMDTLEKMKQNIAAALDPVKLSAAEHAALQLYAKETEHLYCRGCDHLCGQALPAGLSVSNTLRCLMYHDTYGDAEKARLAFAQLPAEAQRIRGVDFARANSLCPHGIDIARHMQRASEVLV
jgi:predicted aldo/keto reductase-like oxidoreductase